MKTCKPVCEIFHKVAGVIFAQLQFSFQGSVSTSPGSVTDDAELHISCGLSPCRASPYAGSEVGLSVRTVPGVYTNVSRLLNSPSFIAKNNASGLLHPAPKRLALKHSAGKYSCLLAARANSWNLKSERSLFPPAQKPLVRFSDIRDKGAIPRGSVPRAETAEGPGLACSRPFRRIGFRTAWWIKRLFGITYSFTGHANDIFCPKPDQRVGLIDLVREASFVVVVSDFGANWLRLILPSTQLNFMWVYNGLDLSVFKSAAPGARPIRLLSIGRLIEKKGFCPSVRLARSLRPPHSLLSQIVGEGPQRSPVPGPTY